MVDPIFGIFVNPIMRKPAPLIISSESNLANHGSRHQEAFLLRKSLPEALWCTQTMTMLLLKQVLTTVAGRRRDAQTIEVSGAYTLLR